MNLAALATTAAERLPLSDRLTRYGIAALVSRTQDELVKTSANANCRFAAEMYGRPIATFVADANAQHYEVPTRFFQLVLGPQRKYSCCYYPSSRSTLAEAEEAALAETARRADLVDGQDILELGCGWGSLSLWMARMLPRSRILAVSNSASQRSFIESEARALGLRNLRIQTADMNIFAPTGTFDRVVSIEMFEHMTNWGALLTRIRGWLKPEGRAFVHVFAHRKSPYRFDHDNPADWIAQHFFTGGIMPSRPLMYEFRDCLQVEKEWWWQGTHYARTARDWLRNFDGNAREIETVLEPVYGAMTKLWIRRWRLFFLATEGLFGHAGGREWGVAHYLMKAPATAPNDLQSAARLTEERA